MNTPSIGSLAPDFTLMADDGTEFQLSSQKGRAVVLFFYPKDNTSGCTVENQDFSERYAAFKELGTIVVGVSPDSVAVHSSFREKYNLAAPLLSDPDHVALSAYGAWGEKSNYGKKYMGVIRSTYLIDQNGMIARYWKVSRVKGHADAVLEATQAIFS